MSLVAVALHDYPAENETEMTLDEGHEYEILEKNESGWWHVSNGEDTGWAPSNYLRDDASPPMMEHEPEPDLIFETDQEMEAGGMPPDPMGAAPPMMEPELELEPEIIVEPEEAAPMADLNGGPPAPPMMSHNDDGAAAPGNSDDVRSALQQIKEIQKAKVCKSCGKDIAGEFVMAKGSHFCVTCFACAQCGSSLAGKSYVERDGAHYCENCYHDKYSPHCARCDQVIRGQYVSALGQPWHPECFSCTQCSRSFDSDQFRKRDNKPYCEECYQQNFAVSCDKCGNVIQGKAFNAQDKHYHQECFVCVKGCTISETDSFHVRDGEIYCRNCYRGEFVKTCHRCDRDISGKFICVLEKYFHDECWNCMQCGKSMMDGEFRQVGDDFHCSDCAQGPAAQQSSKLIDERPPTMSADGGPPPPNPYSNSNAARPAVPAAKRASGGGFASGSAPVRSTPTAQPKSSTPPRKQYAIPKGMEYVVGEDNSYMESQNEQEKPQTIDTCYSYAQLKAPDGLPVGVDRKQLEKYMSDQEFKEVFKMLPSDFEGLAQWKKASLKKKAGIF